MKKTLALALWLALAGASAQALTVRTLTGKVLDATGTAIQSGQVIATPLGTTPADGVKGALSQAPATYPITSGSLTCSLTCSIVSPANYRFQVYKTVGTQQQLVWTFTAGVVESSAAVSLQDIYGAVAGVISVSSNPVSMWHSGAGAPTGACVTGSTYSRTDGGAGSTFYVCESLAWQAK